MKILLDTHLMLWGLYDPDKLSKKAKRIISDPDNWICYSLASLWEIELKHLKYPDVFPFSAKDLAGDAADAGYVRIDLRPEHIFTLGALDQRGGDKPHKDPFDRMLIAQTKADQMIFLTHDKALNSYEEQRVIIV